MDIRRDHMPPSLLQEYAIKAGQEGVVSLAIGQSEMEPPSGLLNLIVEYIVRKGYARYTAAVGDRDVRSKLVELFSRLGVKDLNVDQIAMSHGAKLLLDVSMRAMADIDDVVIWFSPGYTYGRTAKHNRIESICLPTADHGFRPDLEALSRVLEDLPAWKKPIVIVNNPVNPTGCVWQKDELQALVEILAKYRAKVITDETYADLVLDGPPITCLGSFDDISDQTIVIRSGSKELRAPAYRIGYMAVPLSYMPRVKDILNDCVGCPNLLARLSAPFLLEHQRFAQEQLPALRAKCGLVGEWCRQNGLVHAPMEGAFYSFIDFDPILQAKDFKDTIELADRLLIEAKVGIIPGRAFSSAPKPDCDSWARISFAGDKFDLVEGLERISRYIG